MTGILRLAILAVSGVGVFVSWNSLHTVSEVEQVIITQFGKPIGEPVTTAGLQSKVPFVQDLNLIEKRILEWDGSPSDMPAKDKLYISVDLFARWRITDGQRTASDRGTLSVGRQWRGGQNPRQSGARPEQDSVRGLPAGRGDPRRRGRQGHGNLRQGLQTESRSGSVLRIHPNHAVLQVPHRCKHHPCPFHRQTSSSS